MQIVLDTKIAEQYHSASQKTRVLTEDWVDREGFCPSCGCDIKRYESNRPVADFFCANCKEEYELKGKNGPIGNIIVDGAYRTMIERLKSEHNPNLFLLSYNIINYEVVNFMVIPKQFFIPEIIEKRNPLSEFARRANWVGCNISLRNIPQSGKIFFIKNKQVEPKNKILKTWRKTLFLREANLTRNKGWICEIMSCIDKLGKKEFTLNEIYSFEKALEKKYPENKHIKDKIRQQLQFLRDKGYLDFIAKGKYRLI
jgi:type II restriction enzyme